MDLLALGLGVGVFLQARVVTKTSDFTWIESYVEKAPGWRLYFFGPVVVVLLITLLLVLFLGPLLAWIQGEQVVSIGPNPSLRIRPELPPGLYSVGSIAVGGILIGTALARIFVRVVRHGCKGWKKRTGNP